MALLTENARSKVMLSVTLITITSIFVLLRFSLKILRREYPRGPDWLCLLATAFFNVSNGLILRCEKILHTVFRPVCTCMLI